MFIDENIIQTTTSDITPKTTQSGVSNSAISSSVTSPLRSGQYLLARKIVPPPMIRKTTLPHSMGDDPPEKSHAPQYVIHVPMSMPVSVPAAKRTGGDL